MLLKELVEARGASMNPGINVDRRAAKRQFEDWFRNNRNVSEMKFKDVATQMGLNRSTIRKMWEKYNHLHLPHNSSNPWAKVNDWYVKQRKAGHNPRSKDFANAAAQLGLSANTARQRWVELQDYLKFNNLPPDSEFRGKMA